MVGLILAIVVVVADPTTNHKSAVLEAGVPPLLVAEVVALGAEVPLAVVPVDVVLD